MLDDVLSDHEVELIRDEMAPLLAAAPFGRNDFEGLQSQRVYALLAKAPSTAVLATHPDLAALLDQLLHPAYLLSAHIAINVHPGETAQMLHPDDGHCALPRPRQHLGVSAVWALDAFTATNGATEILPGSHLWGGETPDEFDSRIRKIEMSAGSVAVFLGSNALIAAARQWARQQETPPRETARNKYNQVKKAATAGISAGSDAWQNAPSSS